VSSTLGVFVNGIAGVQAVCTLCVEYSGFVNGIAGVEQLYRLCGEAYVIWRVLNTICVLLCNMCRCIYQDQSLLKDMNWIDQQLENNGQLLLVPYHGILAW